MNIYEELGKIQKALKAPKGQFNEFGKYKYRSCEDILEALKPIIPNGAAFTVQDDLVMIGTRYYIKATAGFYMDGCRVECAALAREPENKKGMDESQITGAASSYARKYALNGLLLIDDTKDADSTNKHGKGEPQKEGKKESKTEQPVGNMTDKQSQFIINIGTGLKDPYSPLSKSEVVELVRWKAQQLKVDSKSKAVADAFLPRKDEQIKPWEKFGSVLDEWLDWKQTQPKTDDVPIFDENGNEVSV